MTVSEQLTLQYIHNNIVKPILRYRKFLFDINYYCDTVLGAHEPLAVNLMTHKLLTTYCPTTCTITHTCVYTLLRL